MKKYIIVLILLFITVTASADKLIISNTVYPRALQEEFAKNGVKLDLSGNDRTEDSWGFIENRGTEFWIFTYKNATMEDFDLVDKITNELYKQGNLK